MNETDYATLVKQAFSKYIELRDERETIEAEIEKLRQLIYATANMLPEAQRQAVVRDMAAMKEPIQIRDASLSDAIRSILEKSARKWLTVSAVRDKLVAAGFDFADYTTNPLASVSTTLKRMVDETETAPIEGVTAYRKKLSRRRKSTSGRFTRKKEM